MTEQEAREQLKCDMGLITFNPSNGEIIPVENLSELNRATYEADKVAITALEKQIPKKSVKDSSEERTHYKCECGYIFYTKYSNGYKMGNTPDYCERCGQKLDWSGI